MFDTKIPLSIFKKLEKAFSQQFVFSFFSDNFLILIIAELNSDKKYILKSKLKR